VRAVLTREAGLNDELRSWLPDAAVVDEVPLTSTRYFEAGEVDEALRASKHYGSFAALVVSSARSAAYVPLAMEALREGGRVLAVGNVSATALKAEGVGVDVVGKGGALGLAPAVTEGPVLLLGVATPRNELRAALDAKGIEVTALACYETSRAILQTSDEKALREGDVVFIGAPSAWSVAQALVRADALVVVPGATTGDIVRQTHERVLEGWGPDLREQLASL
jgi:uroporphyrinogen-III synthase